MYRITQAAIRQQKKWLLKNNRLGMIDNSIDQKFAAFRTNCLSEIVTVHKKSLIEKSIRLFVCRLTPAVPKIEKSILQEPVYGLLKMLSGR